MPLGDTRAWRAQAAGQVDTRGLTLTSYRAHLSRALADTWGYAKARRANIAARERDREIVAARRAARGFLTQPARVTQEGERCRAEYLMTPANYNELAAQLAGALRLMGAQP